MSRFGFLLRRCSSVATSSSRPSPPTPSPVESSDLSGLVQKASRSLLRKSESWMTSYEEFIGIKQVKEAHARVLHSENEFVKAQEDRRQAQVLMITMQLRLREVRTDLDRTPRGDNNYLELVKREIELIRDERALRDKFETEERRERELFNSLSNALRFSHEKERAQTEKTKYWSIFASLLGAFLGIVGTTINSQLKLRKLRQMLTENTEASAAAVLSKIEQVTANVEQSDKLIDHFNSLREAVLSQVPSQSESEDTSDHDRLLPTNHENLIEVLEQRLQANEEQRRRDLVIATVSILIIVPIFILKFSAS